MDDKLQSSADLSETQKTDESVDVPNEGTRLKELRDAINKTMKSFTRNLKLVKPIPNVDTNILRHLQSEAISQLESNIKCEFDQMCEEENVEPLLNNLDKMIVQGDIKAHGWNPSGNVEVDICAHTVTLKQEKLKALQKLLDDLEAKNKLLRSKAEKKEKYLIQTKDQIKQIENSLTQIVDTERSAVDSLDSTGHS